MGSELSRCRLVVALALVGSCAAGCGAQAAEGSPAAPEAPEPANAQRVPLTDLDALEHDLEVAEQRLERQLAKRSQLDEGAAAAPSQPAAPPTNPAPAPPPSGVAGGESAADAEQKSEARSGTPCDLACRALSSMGRSADGICQLTGDEDGRCVRARRRVSDAERRVSAGGCRCIGEP